MHYLDYLQNIQYWFIGKLLSTTRLQINKLKKILYQVVLSRHS